MWRFLLPAFAMVSALLVLFAGALGDLRSWPTLSKGTSNVIAVMTPHPEKPVTATPARQSAAPPASPAPDLLAARKALQQQVADLQQQTNTLQTEIDRRKQELDQRTQELNQRTQEISQQTHQLEGLHSETDKLRQKIDTLHQQQAGLTRQRAQEQQLAAANQAHVPSAYQPSPPQQPPASSPAPQAGITPLAVQQLLSARQWLAAGRPEEARRVLATVQTQMVMQPVAPDQPHVSTGNVPATEIGEAIRWLDIGATGQAMQAISRAIGGSTTVNEQPKSRPEYSEVAPPRYFQSVPREYYSEFNYR